MAIRRASLFKAVALGLLANGLFVVCVFGFLGCGARWFGMSKAELTKIDETVLRLHYAMRHEGSVLAFYNETDSDFKRAISAADFELQLRMIRFPFGIPLKTNRVLSAVNVDHGQIVHELTFRTEFEKGVAKEVFTFARRDGQFLLHKYEFIPPPGGRQF